MLVQTQDEFETQIKAVQGAIDMVQIDIADGVFVPNTTWKSPTVTQELLKIDCELHLMVADPLKEAVQWMGVPQVKRVFFHYEAVEEDAIEHTIRELGRGGWQVGIVLNPDTNLSVLENHTEHLDAVMLMGVHPGFQGQSYIPETTERLKKVKQTYPGLFVSLDGAVNLQTIPDIITSGLDAICPGSAVFHTDKTPVENVADIKTLINTLT